MSKRIWILLIVSLFSVSCSHKPKFKDLGHEKWFSSEESQMGGNKVYKYQYDNGLKLLVLEDHSAPTFAYHTWFNVGSMDEQNGLTGLAHLFEHMMFKATKNRSDGQFDKLLETAGAEGENAFTSRDYTAYVQSLPRTGKQDTLKLIASLESDRMANLIVDDEVLNKEREVVHNERRFRNENSPDGQMYERIYELAYTKHAYHWPVIGYEQDLKNAKSQECLSFYKKYYAPNNAVVIVVGDVNHAEVANVVSDYYGDIPPSVIKREKIEPEPAQTAERRETMKLKTQVEKLVVAYRIPNNKSGDFPAIEVIRNILTVGKSSILYRKLVDGGIATEVDVYSSESKDPGLFIFFVNMQKGRTAKQALSVVEAEIQKIMQGQITPEDMKRSIAQMRFSVFDDLASNEAKAKFMGFYEIVTGGFENGIKMVTDVQKVTKEEVIRAAKNFFKPNNKSVLFGIPETKLAKGE